MVISINYQKRKNSELFKSLEKPDLTFLSKTQNYIPIYTKFFSLNETNFNSINLNHKWYISNVRDKLHDDLHIYSCTLKNMNNQNKTKCKEVFFKIAPLIDPFKYLVGKYDPNDEKNYTLPQLLSNENDCNERFLENNNSSYVDSFFSFLSSQLIYEFDFIHGIDFYGSFLGIKNNFQLNIIDDLEYLNSSEYFLKNKNILFKVDDYSYLFENDDNEKKKNPIKIYHNSSAKSNLSLESINEDIFEDIFLREEYKNTSNMLSLDDLKDLSLDLIDITNTNEIKDKCDNKTTTLKSGSTCSSRTSHTSIEELNEDELINIDNKSEKSSKSNKTEILENNDEDDENFDEEDIEYEDEDDDEETEISEDKINATIEKFPVQVICLENCENTFDNLILSNELSEDEWFSAFMQIIMILISYQKVFSFTHNDLHTNNVMYVPTQNKFLYYCYKNKYYKVPTFGKIYKIIDFGRSIYKYNGKLFCSDSFQTGGDAATQYNTEPYFNDKKPRLEPNFSFDLCRLACSIFDYLVDDINEIKDLSSCDPVLKLIVEWCLDDKGINLLYKNNGVERYPDFKLYKMIARCVHNHTPQAQLERPEFNKYTISKKDIETNKKIINIDELPVLI